MLNRSELLRGGAALALFAPGLLPTAAAASQTEGPALNPSADGVPVAFLLSDGAVMIDFAGPWEVFQDAYVPTRTASPFNLYTVAQTTKPITISGGAKILPQFDFATVPIPKVVVVPAQSDPTDVTKNWLRQVARTADVVMSVCTGAFVLAQAGLLDGLTVTTHHSAFSTLAMQYPTLNVKRGVRYVDNGRIATSAGLSAGIDLALHIVERYYGGENARRTAYEMEYLSQSWQDPRSNAIYGKPPAVAAGLALCPVCWMSVDPKNALSSLYHGKRYYFCMPSHQQRFLSAPERFISAAAS